MLEHSPERIGFGQRFLALFLDFIAILIAGMIVTAGLIFAGIMGKEKVDANFGAQISEHVTGAIMLFLFLWASIEALTGYTPGKYVLGLRAGTANGEQGTIKFYLLRYLVKGMTAILSFLTLGIHLFTGINVASTALLLVENIWSMIILVGCFFALGAKKQALHDIIVKSAVYRREELAGSSREV